MASKANLHRETLRAALRVIQTAETLEEARIRGVSSSGTENRRKPRKAW